MNYNPTLLLLIFFQAFSFSQNTLNTIDIKIEQKHFFYKSHPVHTYELKFDNNGHLLQRIGYNIKMLSNTSSTDLIETYAYSEEGLLSSILEQEKDKNNKIIIRFHSLHYYNEKKQLIEMMNFNYILDSIPEKITFDYDVNGNLTQINKGNSDYIINQYDSTNKCIKSQLFKNKSCVKDLQMANDVIFLYRDIPEIKTNKDLSFTYFRSSIPDRYIGVIGKNKIEFENYKNGIIKEKKITISFPDDKTNYLDMVYLIKCDGKTKYDNSIIKKINKEIQQIEIWE